MSDTPKTDAVIAFAPHYPGSPYQERIHKLCAELERENAALRSERDLIKRQHDFQFDKAVRLERENASLRKGEWKARYWEKLEAENAALKQALDAQVDYQRELRADRDRLDWLLTKASVDQMIVLTSDASEARKAIDSAMGVSNP